MFIHQCGYGVEESFKSIFVNDLLGDEIVTDIFECDFKDKLRYTESIELQSMSNLEKWLAYDLYAKMLDKSVEVKLNTTQLMRH